jgi:Protein of unknown function (DUF1302)
MASREDKNSEIGRAMMTKKTRSVDTCGKRRKNALRRLHGLGMGLPALLALTPAAQAFTLYNGPDHGNNLIVHLTIGTSYTGMLRVAPPNSRLVSGAANPNGNDGDANMSRGIVNNTFEVLPVLDIKDNNFGMHFSGEYFINTVYLGTNNNNQASTVNPVLAKNTDFASQTRTANGMNGRLLDAFVYDSWAFGGGQHLTVKAGQQTLFWGQSLFSLDGISGGQAPVDAIQAQNLVNPQAQQVFLPVGQIVLTYQLNPTYTLQGYYQYQWEPTALQGVGSYFSTTDVLGPGGYRIIAEQVGGENFYLSKTGKDLTPPSQNGQFGLSLQATYGDYDVGLFGLRYDAKNPTVYESVSSPLTLTPSPGGFSIGQYKAVYPRDIWLYGTSLATTIGATNVAGEISLRTHDPLAGGGMQTAANPGDANSNPLYPVGNVVVGLVNFVYGSPSLRFDPGGITFLGEIEYSNVIRVTDNKDLLPADHTSQAGSFDIEVEPAYYEVLPNLSLTFPISVGCGFAGKSYATGQYAGAGSYSVGVTATYKTSWIGALAFVAPIAPHEAPNDRSYVSLNLSHTF